MAFVIRSDRDIKISTLNSTNPGPGEYDNEIEPKRNKKTNYSIPFNTSANRTRITQSNNPGPGAYEISTSCFTQPNETKHLNENKQSNQHPDSSMNIAFLASANRFPKPNYSNDLQIKQTKTTDSLNLHFSTSSKLFESNQRHKPKIGSNNKALSSYRVVSIPSKQMFGYNYCKEGDIFLVKDPDSLTKLSGEKTDSAGPGHYDIESKWTRNVVRWEKPSHQSNSISSLLKSEFIDNRDNIGNDIKHHQPKNYKQQLGPSLMHERRQYFLELLRENKSNPVAELLKDKVYEDTPGPGFYTKEYFLSNEKNNKDNNPNAVFGGTSDRFKANIKGNNEIGPGSYFDDFSKYERLMTKTNQLPKPINKDLNRINQNKDNDCVYLRNIQKKAEQKDILGPGSYMINDSYLKKEVSKISNFGSIAERFKKQKGDESNSPDLGDYFKQNNWTTQRNIKDNNKSNNVKDNRLIELNNQKTNIKSQEPSVGSYSPGIIYSIAYGVQSKYNPYQSQNVSFNTTDKRSRLYDHVKNKIGPGLYDIENNQKITQSCSPFNQKDKRFKTSKTEHLKTEPGPGSYNHNSQFDWKKKTFNVLFI